MAGDQETQKRIAEIEEERKRLKAQLDRTLGQLDFVEKRQIPDTQPYISLKRAIEIKDLAGPPLGIRAALKEDIAQLRRHIEALKREATEVRNVGVDEMFRRKREAVRRAERDIEARARRIMNEAATTRGYLTEDELIEVQAGAEVALENYTELLGDRPSEQAMRDVLDQLADTMALGMEGSDAQKKAFAGLQTAAHKLVERAKQDMAAKPTSANMRKLLGSAARAAVVGNEAPAAGALAEVAPWAEKQRDLAEARFRKTPTSENFKALFNAEAQCIQVGGQPLPERPAGLKRVRDGNTHKLAHGESLSALSKTYYGSFSYWDVIARANVDLIQDFDFPPPGATLRIP